MTFTFEQIIMILSLAVAFLAVLSTLLSAFLAHRSAVKVLLKEKQIDCYCRLANVLLNIQGDRISVDNYDEIQFLLSSAVLLGSKPVKDATEYFLEALSLGKDISGPTSVLLQYLKKEIQSSSVLLPPR